MEVRVIAAMAADAGPRGITAMLAKDLAREVGCSLHSVKSARRAARELGILVLVGEPRRGGGNPTYYRFVREWLDGE